MSRRHRKEANNVRTFGRGALVNWGGVVAASEVDYNAWHSLEHMPERLAVPGFAAAAAASVSTARPSS